MVLTNTVVRLGQHIARHFAAEQMNDRRCARPHNIEREVDGKQKRRTRWSLERRSLGKSTNQNNFPQRERTNGPVQRIRNPSTTSLMIGLDACLDSMDEGWARISIASKTGLR